MKNNTILDESDKIRAALDETSDDNDRRQREILSMVETIRKEREAISSGDDNDDEKGNTSVALESAAAICNEAEEAFSFRQYNKAVELCINGLQSYPDDIDIMTNIICFGKEAGRADLSELYANTLLETSRQRFRKQTFVMLLEYLLSSRNVFENEKEIRSLISDFNSFFPYEEKRIAFEAELELHLGNRDGAINILKDALVLYTNAQVCAKHLAQLEIQMGDYAMALEHCRYGLACTSVEAEKDFYSDTDTTAFLLFYKLLCEDYLIHHKFIAGQALRFEAERIREEYKLLRSKYERKLDDYLGKIESRINVLQFLIADIE